MLGRRGEALAARHLIDSGYRILARNWRVRRYELDLVAQRAGVVVFAEVKTRSAGYHRGADALSRSQRRRIRRAAESWIHSHPGVGAEFRFDLISVDASGRGTPRILHLEEAFYGDDAV